MHWSMSFIQEYLFKILILRKYLVNVPIQYNRTIYYFNDVTNSTVRCLFCVALTIGLCHSTI